MYLGDETPQFGFKKVEKFQMTTMRGNLNLNLLSSFDKPLILCNFIKNSSQFQQSYVTKKLEKT